MNMIFKPRSDAKPRTKPKPVVVTICVYESIDDAECPPIREHVVNLSNPDKARWLVNLLRWSGHNGHYVEIEPATNEDVTATSRRKLRA
jgi:hypothetical protein